MSDQDKAEMAKQFMIKSNELQARASHLTMQIRKGASGNLAFEREMVRQSLGAVIFWLGEIDVSLTEVDPSGAEVQK